MLAESSESPPLEQELKYTDVYGICMDLFIRWDHAFFGEKARTLGPFQKA